MKSYIHSLLLGVALSLFHCFNANAQNTFAGINLSLYNDISTQPFDSLQKTYFNLGLVSKINHLYGIGINGLGTNVLGNTVGIQISGLTNITKGFTTGMQVGGIANISSKGASGIVVSGITNVWGGSINGVGLTGLTNVISNNGNGFVCAGLANIVGKETNGLEIAGLTNFTGSGHSTGVKLAGLANIVNSGFSGFQVAGLGNLNMNDLNGIQISGLANFNVGKTKGVQISGINNAATDLYGVQIAGVYNDVRNISNGVQIGLVNLANETNDGVQIGLVNYSKTTAKTKIGLVNINPETDIQLMIYGGNMNKGNLAVRFKNRLFYNIIGVGNNYIGLDKKFSISSFYRSGMVYNISKRVSISGDLGFQNIENLKNDSDENIPTRMYALEARGNIEFQIKKGISIFGSAGYSVARYYNKDKTYSQKPIIEFGIVLF